MPGMHPTDADTDIILKEPPGGERAEKYTTYKWWVLIAIGIGTFMSALDGSVVNTILPVIGQSFGSSIASIEWVVTIYLLVLSGLLLSFGRLGDIQGHKRVYLAGFTIFLACSALCGLARSVEILIVCRAVQALGAAMLAANSPAILTKNFPASERGRALGLQATMTYLGLTVGPSLGGWLAEKAGWQMVFYINVPVGLLAFWLSLRFIQSDQPGETSERFDIPGALTFITGLVLLLFGLNQGHNLGWDSWPVLGSLAASAVFLVIFIVVERNVSHPMLDLSLFSNRIFSAAASSAVLNYICVYSILFLMPFYLIQGRGYTPGQAGLLLTAMPITMAIVAPISGALSDRIGTRGPAIVGMLALFIGLLLLARLDQSSPAISIASRMAVAGAGIGIFISPNTSALMGAAPRYRQGIAAGILASCRNVGMALGVGLAGAILTTLLTSASDLNIIGNTTDLALFSAVRISFLVAAGFALLGALLTVIRAKPPVWK